MSIPYLPLERWKRLWSVSNGAIRCKACGASQEEWQVRRPFMHNLQCPFRTSENQFPNRELRGLLEDGARLGWHSD